MMRAACILAAGLLLQDDRAAKIGRAVDWMANADPEVREMGRQQVAAFGQEARPALERSLATAGLLEVAKAWRAAETPAAGPRFIPEAALEELPADDPGARDVAKLDRAFVERYVKTKYNEAMGFVRKRNYQKAWELSGALLALEPRSAHVEAVRKLRRHADAMILQTTLLEAKLLHEKPAYAAGEPLELRLRMKNIHAANLTVSFGKPGAGAAPAAGVVVVELETRVADLTGASQTWTRSQEVKIENEIPISPGGQWEVAFAPDLSSDVEERELVREVTVNAWTQPVGLEVQGRDAARRIQFESATFRIIPAKYARFLADPLGSLGKTIDGGPVQETYVCSQLLQGEARQHGIVMLVQAMAKSENRRYAEALSWVLLHLTGERLGSDPKKWQEWLEKKGGK